MAPKFAGQIRTELGSRLHLVDENSFKLCFIVDFPMYEIDEETGNYIFTHNPFSMPQGGMDALDVYKRQMVPFLGIKKERLPECSAAFTQLAESGLLYGFYLHYEEADLSWMFSSQVVDAMVKNHCYFGGYICRDATDTELQKKVYQMCIRDSHYADPLICINNY